jgi:HD superfamily phosphohydrolase
MSKQSIEEVAKCIANFSNEIRLCFDNSDWEKLAEILASRHIYFTQILSPPVSEGYARALVQLVQDVLAEDAEALSKIQDHKKKLIEHHNLLENGRRAIKAYRGR